MFMNLEAVAIILFEISFSCIIIIEDKCIACCFRLMAISYSNFDSSFGRILCELFMQLDGR
jgi:hypothetical protein